MAYLLEAHGYVTLAAADGETGLEIAARDAPDLIICDLQMPKVNGYEVARRAKSDPALRAIPLVAVTAFAMVGDREKALDAGFDGYLPKPIDPETFVQQVGTCLQRDLRRDALPCAEASSGSAATPRTRGRTILVVDNLQVNLELASALLESSGYSVVTTQSPAHALELARRSGPDLILSDVCMPGGSGYDLIRAIKSEPGLRSTPFVFLTSTATNESDRQRGLALGAAKFLFRPLEPQVLLTEIESCLAAAKES
jgi:two-component system cell cycle response regulator